MKVKKLLHNLWGYSFPFVILVAFGVFFYKNKTPLYDQGHQKLITLKELSAIAQEKGKFTFPIMDTITISIVDFLAPIPLMRKKDALELFDQNHCDIEHNEVL